MKLDRKSGAALAAAAAVLMMSATVPVAPAAADYKVKCFGLNSCKGHGQCKSLGNSCAGQNSCKGKGVLMMGKATCLSKHGSLTQG
jgi:hypothetical protein